MREDDRLGTLVGSPCVAERQQTRSSAQSGPGIAILIVRATFRSPAVFGSLLGCIFLFPRPGLAQLQEQQWRTCTAAFNVAQRSIDASLSRWPRVGPREVARFRGAVRSRASRAILTMRSRLRAVVTHARRIPDESVRQAFMDSAQPLGSAISSYANVARAIDLEDGSALTELEAVLPQFSGAGGGASERCGEDGDRFLVHLCDTTRRELESLRTLLRSEPSQAASAGELVLRHADHNLNNFAEAARHGTAPSSFMEIQLIDLSGVEPSDLRVIRHSMAAYDRARAACAPRPLSEREARERLSPLPVTPDDPAPGSATQPPAGMILIRAGAFLMGSPVGIGLSLERPQHRVQVGPFFMDRTEVTVAQFRECVRAGRCAAIPMGVSGARDESQRALDDRLCNGGRSDAEQNPMNCVDWSQAATFCQWRGGRLPTEAEWEYAARGTTGQEYPWGNGPPDAQLCWNRRSPTGATVGTCEVGIFPSGHSPFGLEDMAGNVAEWTSSSFVSYANVPRSDGQHESSPANSTTVVVRGGSWASQGTTGVIILRSACRVPYNVDMRLNTIGFRCAIGISAASAQQFSRQADPPARINGGTPENSPARVPTVLPDAGVAPRPEPRYFF